jgi:predicted nuclease of predicted toxin-antitoxin system
VRVKLDENLPLSAASIFAAAGHDVDTVEDEGLAGCDDPTVSRVATGVGRLVVTLDRGFGDIQRYPPGSHAGILVLRLDDQSAPSIRAALGTVVAATDLVALAGCVAVFRNGTLRVRRPIDN